MSGKMRLRLGFIEQLTVQQRNYFYLLELNHLISQTVFGGNVRIVVGET
ncbi:hypothetical protein XCR1_1880032 [Xenorhabdus cabanillasii JM26]|uniref:Uncharacterized protein n=1 Tax=Xenorhabdus cabanillasii JM26 TaxID=1427517 RepID=W1J1W2_9GAMM|nr:hypothetical protein XCR1_1880032 [Xenorhabdus cabanillasii JM26]